MLHRYTSPAYVGCLLLGIASLTFAEGLRHSIHEIHEMRRAANMHTSHAHAQVHDHRKHGAFGMDFSTKMLRKYSHELWQGVWWGIAANLALLAIVAAVIWLKQSIQATKAHRRERAHAHAAMKSHPDIVVAPSATSTAVSKAAGSARITHESADRGGSGLSAGHKQAAAISVHQTPSAPDFPPTTNSSFGPAAASKHVSKAAAPASAAPGAAAFYKGTGRSMYSTAEE